jgi:anti-sigma factor RsiW
MSACPDKAMLLQGLVDGELDAVNAQACEAHLKTCPACDAEYRRLLALREAVTAPCVAHAAPGRLRAGIEAMLAAETQPTRPTQVASRLPRRAAWGAGGLGAALAASLAVMLVIPQVTEAGVEKQLVASHVRSLLANHLTDVQTSNQHVVKPWFNGKVDIAPPVPELAAQGFPLVGGRLDYIGGRVVPAVVYSRRAHTVNLFVWPAEGRVLNETRLVQRDGYSIVEWSDHGLRFAAVSDVGLPELRQFHRAYEAGSSN